MAARPPGDTPNPELLGLVLALRRPVCHLFTVQTGKIMVPQQDSGAHEPPGALSQGPCLRYAQVLLTRYGPQQSPRPFYNSKGTKSTNSGWCCLDRAAAEAARHTHTPQTCPKWIIWELEQRSDPFSHPKYPVLDQQTYQTAQIYPLPDPKIQDKKIRNISIHPSLHVRPPPFCTDASKVPEMADTAGDNVSRQAHLWKQLLPWCYLDKALFAQRGGGGAETRRLPLTRPCLASRINMRHSKLRAKCRSAVLSFFLQPTPHHPNTIQLGTLESQCAVAFGTESDEVSKYYVR